MWKNPTESQGFLTSPGSCFGPPNGMDSASSIGRTAVVLTFWTADWAETKRGEASSQISIEDVILLNTQIPLLNVISVELSAISLLDFWMTSNKKNNNKAVFCQSDHSKTFNLKKNKNDHRVTATPKKIISEPARPTSSSPEVESWSHCNQPPFLYVAKPAGDSNFNTARPRKRGLISN